MYDAFSKVMQHDEEYVFYSIVSNAFVFDRICNYAIWYHDMPSDEELSIVFRCGHIRSRLEKTAAS